MAIAFSSWYVVETTTATHFNDIKLRSNAESQIAQLEDAIETLNLNVHQLIVRPIPLDPSSLDQQFEQIDEITKQLGVNGWMNHNPMLRRVYDDMLADNRYLRDMLHRFRLFRSELSSIFDLMIQATGVAVTDARKWSRTNENQYQAYALFSDVHLLSNKLLDQELKLFSNQLHLSSAETKKHMPTWIQQVGNSRTQIQTRLTQLNQLQETGQLTQVQRTALRDIETGFTLSQEIYLQHEQQQSQQALSATAKQSLLPVLPAIKQYQQRIAKIRQQISAESARNISQLSNAIHDMFLLGAGLVITVVLMLTGGFLIMRQALLKPIRRIARALQAEATGDEPGVLPLATIEETIALTEAFDQMRDKVRQREAHLDFLAHHDPLTDLPNRILFRDRLQNAIYRAKRHENMACLLFLDLDRFKHINDSLGHNIGDELLKCIANRLIKSVRHMDTVARLGGDEFAIVLEEISDPGQIDHITKKILYAVTQPIHIQQHNLHVSTSIGVAIAPQHSNQVDTLIKNADTAMYQAKEKGVGQYCIYDEAMSVRVAEDFGKEAAIRHALRNQAFTLYYQPIMDLAKDEVCIYEALMRWEHSHSGTLLPGEFLHIMEDSGQIVPITDWLIDKAMHDFIQHGANLPKQASLSINLSARLLQDPAIVDSISRSLDRNAFPAGRLILEITEDTLIQRDQQAQEILSKIRKMGARIAIDDFGKGQSSLNRLRRFAIDIVKIDKEFIANVPENEADAQLVVAVISMAHALGKTVIAEGVERIEQIEFLRISQSDYAQGFMIGQPLPIDRVVTHIPSDNWVSR